MSDLIDRQAAIELVKDVCDAIMSGCKRHYDSEVGDEVYDDTLEVDAILKCNKGIRNALRDMPSAKPEEIALRALHESCTDCPLYDKDRHRCPRFNKVIPETLREVISAQPDYQEVLGWLLAYHTKSFDVHGRYLPHEVISWLINDFTKVFIAEREHDE